MQRGYPVPKGTFKHLETLFVVVVINWSVICINNESSMGMIFLNAQGSPPQKELFNPKCQ